MEQFAVSSIYRELVEQQRPSIEAEFRVTVRLSSYADPESLGPGPGPAVGPPADQSDSLSLPSMVGALLPGISDNAVSSAQIWIDIEGESSGITKAKQYILTLCQGPNELWIEENLSEGFGDRLESKLEGFQSETHSRIKRIPGTDTLVICGDETSVACARSLIDEECNKLRRCQPDIRLDSPEWKLEIDSFQKNSPKDSGCATDDSVSVSHFRTASPARTTHRVQDVRTPSPNILKEDAPTLERTIEERRSPRLIAHSLSAPDFETTRLSEAQLLDNRIVGIINGMQKLGYSRDQVNHVLRRLGPSADHNDVLGALVNQRPSKTDLEYLEVAETEVTKRARDISDGFDSNEPEEDESSNLRTIIVDGSNVAMSFGNKDVFACKGIEIVVDWFCKRGHRKIIVFVPAWRKEASKPETPITDQEILNDLEKRNILVWTPSRRINGRRIVCYDDRYIVKTAADEDGIIVSNDNFRDIQNERSDWKKVIAERLLMYSFVNNRFMPPDDPLGRHGPSLDNFLRMKPTTPDHLPQACPYGKKCTYGNKCKYYHADRPNRPMKSISETLKERDKNRKEKAKLNPDRTNKYTSVSSAPIPGYVPPEEVPVSPEWHTTPLPGHSPQSSSLRRGQRITSESSALQTSPKLSRSPHYMYESEQRSQSPYSLPRDDVLRSQDLQHYHDSPKVSRAMSQASTQPVGTPPSEHTSYTYPLPSLSQHSSTVSQRDLQIVPLQRYPSPPRLQMEESLTRKRVSVPAVKYGSGEPLRPTPSEVGFQRRSSYNDLVSDFQHMRVQESSGEMLPREVQQSYNYGNPFPQSHRVAEQLQPYPSRAHPNQPSPGQLLPGQFHPGQPHNGQSYPNQAHSGHPYSSQPHPNQQIFQGANSSSVAYHSNDPFRASHMIQSQDQMIYDPHAYKQPPGYASPSSEFTPSPYYSQRQVNSDWPSQQPLPQTRRAPEQFQDEQRQHIYANLASRFSPEQVKAVMQRHPHELNPRKLLMYMQTNT